MGVDLTILCKTCTANMAVEYAFCFVIFVKIARVVIVINTGH